MTIQCCVCKMIKDGSDWKFDGHGGRKEASHTYCPRCLKNSIAAMETERAQTHILQPVRA